MRRGRSLSRLRSGSHISRATRNGEPENTHNKENQQSKYQQHDWPCSPLTRNDFPLIRIGCAGWIEARGWSRHFPHRWPRRSRRGIISVWGLGCDGIHCQWRRFHRGRYPRCRRRIEKPLACSLWHFRYGWRGRYRLIIVKRHIGLLQGAGKVLYTRVTLVIILGEGPHNHLFYLGCNCRHFLAQRRRCIQ